MFTVLSVLENSRKLVKKNWTKGSYFSDGAVCSAGAIGRTFGRADGVPPNETLNNTDGLTKGDLLASEKALRLLAICMARENSDIAKEEGIVANNITDDDAVSVVTTINDNHLFTKKNVLNSFSRAINYAKRRHYDGK